MMYPVVYSFHTEEQEMNTHERNASGSEAAIWAVGDSCNGYGKILCSDDGGRTWSRQGGLDRIPTARLSGVAAADRMHLWAVGGRIHCSPAGVILLTDDGERAGPSGGTQRPRNRSSRMSCPLSPASMPRRSGRWDSTGRFFTQPTAAERGLLSQAGLTPCFKVSGPWIR